MRKLLRAGGPASWWVDGALIFVVAAVLVWPLFKLKYMHNWGSIESTFIADARFLRDHWPHPRWQPLWYTGTRFDYVYPPALRYGTAGLMKLNPKLIPPRAYHLYIAILYCLGIAGVYVLARRGTGWRIPALFAAFAVAIASPSFLMIKELRLDSWAGSSEPQRLSALVRYGEGPHVSSLGMLGFALAFSLAALGTGRKRYLGLAALFAALAVSHNFYGATALAMFFPILVWSFWITHQDWAVVRRAAAIAALAWGLTAFWLVPSYITVTLDNMRFVSERGNRWSLWVTLVLVVAYAKLSERWARGRKELAYRVFLGGALVFFLLNVVGNYYLKFRIIGEPGRLVPELDLILFLTAAELLRVWWESGRKWAAVALAAVCLAGGARYVRHAWEPYVPYPDYRDRVEFRITDWLAKNMPDSRAYTPGSVRFWYNVWYDLAEIGGGSEQGLMNGVVQPATFRLGYDQSAQDGIEWMQCLGADVFISTDKESEEVYKDVQHPRKFDGVLPVVFDDGKGARIYKVPRRYKGLARVVDAKKLSELPVPPEDVPQPHLKQLAALLEDGPDAPVETRWETSDRLKIKARVSDAQAVFVQVAHDPSWKAYSGGTELPVSKSQLNFIRIDAPPGDREIDLVFELPFENLVGRMATVASLAILVMLMRKKESGI